MAGSVKPVRSESVRFLVGGVRKGQGVVLLYPDKLASVKTYAEIWGCVLGTFAVAAATYPFASTLGGLTAVIGVWLGAAIGRFVDRGLASRAVADSPMNATIIPLDMVASLQTLRSDWFSGRLSGETLVVTTADGSQYEFRGKTGSLQTDIGRVLAGLGRDVRATTAGLTVTSQLLADG